MKVLPYIWSVALLLVFVCSCKTRTSKDNNSEVKFQGRIDATMSGDATGSYSIDSLRNAPDWYVLGSMDDLAGEIQIFNGQDFSSIVDGDSVIIGANNKMGAAFVVYAQVKNWKNISIPLSVTNTEALIGFFEYNEESELNVEKPFMFIIEGNVEQLDWHVLTPSMTDSVVSTKDHKHHAKSGSLVDQDVEVLGVYSKDHEGIFTHHGIPVHMHFRTLDGTLAGHVDDLELGPEMNLKIPPSK